MMKNADISFTNSVKLISKLEIAKIVSAYRIGIPKINMILKMRM